MTVFYNWRFQPFTEISYPVELEEEHTIEWHEEWNSYGIELHESPYLESPSNIDIIEDVTGGITFTEVPRATNPNSGQYRVDYDAETYFGTGRIEFNAADNGKEILVDYKGMGTVVKNRYYLEQYSIISTNLSVSGNIWRVDGPQIFNQIDAALEYHCFDDSDTNVEYGTNGTDNKTSLELTGPNTTSYYSPSGGTDYIPLSAFTQLQFFLHLSSSGLSAGNFIFAVDCYDKEFVSLGTLTIRETNWTEIASGYIWKFAAMNNINDTYTDCEYVRIKVYNDASITALGKVYMDYIWGQSFGVPVEIAKDIMSEVPANIWLPSNLRGSINLIWLDSVQSYTIAFDDGTGPGNITLVYAGRFKFKIHSVWATYYTLDAASPDLLLYKGSAGSTAHIIEQMPDSSGGTTIIANELCLIPVSAFDSNGGAIIRCKVNKAALLATDYKLQIIGFFIG
jgi:hypothetical protein